MTRKWRNILSNSVDLDSGPLVKFVNLSLGSQDFKYKQCEGLSLSEQEIGRGNDKQMC